MNVPDLTCLHGFMYADLPLRHKAEKSIPFSSNSKGMAPDRFYNKRYYSDIIWNNSPLLNQLRAARKVALNNTLVHKHCHEHPIIIHHSEAADIMLKRESEGEWKVFPTQRPTRQALTHRGSRIRSTSTPTAIRRCLNPSPTTLFRTTGTVCIWMKRTS